MNRLRIIVSESIVRLPMGGMAWHHLQYALGLAALGHDVYCFGDSNDYEWSCYDPVRHVTDRDPGFGLAFAGRTFDRVGLGARWAYYDAHTDTWLGPCGRQARELCESADLFLNLGHSNPVRSWHADIPVRVLIDTDPAFTQVRHLTDPLLRERALQHTAFLSYGENFGAGRSLIPDDGLPWQSTRQPVVLDQWPSLPGSCQARFSTVMQWDSYPPREYGGQRYHMKSASFEDYIDLPSKTGPVLELALGSVGAPRDRLRSRGWIVRDPFEASMDPWAYQDYIRSSKAEFSVAKHGYVVSRSGWFSERSAVYLATGRPVVTQETGFSEWLPSGAGLLAFRSPDEALAGIEEVNRRYELHCRAAREIAAEYFDARKVLTRLLDDSFAREPQRGAADSAPQTIGLAERR